MKRQLVVLMAALVLIGIVSTQASADKGWKFEITPNIWFVGIDADVTVRNQKVEVDVGFDDLFDKVDLAGELFLTAQNGPWVFWGQFDYLSLNEDFKRTSISGEADSDTTFVAAGVGHQFNVGITKGSTLDVLIGARYVSMENELDIDGVGKFKQSTDIVDPILILRPSVPIVERLRFNPTVSIGGGGDSDLVYELQPHLQYQFAENIAGRIGYRRLYYDVEGDNMAFEGSFHGFILGLGVTF
jgi:hypothetical protein